MIMSIILFIIVIALLAMIISSTVRIVPQAHAYVVERLGAYQGTWSVGLHVKVPFIDRVARKVNLKEQVVDFPPQPVITKDNVTMQIDTDKIRTVIGPGGKTINRIIDETGVKIDINDDGHVFIDDEEITKYPVYKRAQAGIGYLPQEASVFRKMSVEDNIMSVLEMTKQTKEQRIEKMEGLIREFRLEKVRKNLGDRLSGGERRRCEIARCYRPEVHHARRTVCRCRSDCR